jgi:hypothetical protein
VVPYDLVPGYVNCFDIGFALDRQERFRVTGNSYQKVRQYLACGRSIITCTTDDSVLVRERLVENVAPDDLAVMEAAVRRLLGEQQDERRRRAARCVAFARKHLSTESALQKRIDYWNSRLQWRAAAARDQAMGNGSAGQALHTRNSALWQH